MIRLKRIFVLSIGGIAMFFSLVEMQAQSSPSKEEVKKAIAILSSEPVLVADRVKPGLHVVAVDSILMQMAWEKENEIFPANELYDSWNTEYVKAYKDIVLPDSYQIDLSGFVMPVEGKITSHFGPRRRRFHYGTDIKLQTGDTVRAAFDGKVRIKQYERRGYGYYLVLRHPNGLETVYGHLSKFLVEQDETVKAGQPIALGGNTGRSTGSHLHFEFRLLGTAINPIEIIDFDEFCTKDDIYVFKKLENKYSSYNKKGKIQYHRIKQGDTLAYIAKKHGITVDRLCKLNNIKPNHTLRSGKSLRIS
ncbi:MAG: peptidoglycan DD-metalloendopeptidase family protein [Dysgonamonadaceae bacterium]|jgi:murein DD-endopeptidase MepM/ murein hydrolase activator NlpD|nr:peptidoglycan DD-metalloendopeptidase family protein [Dysgonamonadaceae bacterium]